MKLHIKILKRLFGLAHSLLNSKFLLFISGVLAFFSCLLFIRLLNVPPLKLRAQIEMLMEIKDLENKGLIDNPPSTISLRTRDEIEEWKYYTSREDEPSAFAYAEKRLLRNLDFIRVVAYTFLISLCIFFSFALIQKLEILIRLTCYLFLGMHFFFLCLNLLIQKLKTYL